MMVVAFMFDVTATTTSFQTMQQKKEKKIENRSTYRASVQIPV